MPRLGALLLALLLTSCATLPPEPEPGAALDWQEHQAKVLDFDSWQVQGRLNIRSTERADTVNLVWDQQPESFEIALSGALGLGGARITGSDQCVLIEKAGEEPVHASSLEELGSGLLGYAFPASELYYWMRGVPAPGAEEEIVLDENQRLAALVQDNWHLEYDRYQEVAGVILPARIRMSHPPYRLTFLISQWDLDD